MGDTMGNTFSIKEGKRLWISLTIAGHEEEITGKFLALFKYVYVASVITSAATATSK